MALVRPSRRNRPDWHARWGVTAGRAHRLDELLTEIVDQILMSLIRPGRPGRHRPARSGALRRIARRRRKMRLAIV